MLPRADNYFSCCMQHNLGRQFVRSRQYCAKFENANLYVFPFFFMNRFWSVGVRRVLSTGSQISSRRGRGGFKERTKRGFQNLRQGRWGKFAPNLNCLTRWQSVGSRLLLLSNTSNTAKSKDGKRWIYMLRCSVSSYIYIFDGHLCFPPYNQWCCK